ncbi:dTDP-4-dehydrorhamnose 3,5-epimerase [Geobacter sp. OR-1]|uniref:dTDP-4-dehydrorhamnose 3,5-epimerase n=1 Tax=Geobacter sp. OR-1 TaxID=1266765 RepID=UPI0005432C07|nr:dTDP-4-dehydrorhamnose 3,5-epimerase [Geobacter sp. OR-1]GAM11009.1 dTDP-4-dehydrorhamnose 3,5-epimerase [Geobacter sp. OR-1]
MKFVELSIPGCYEIVPTIFRDLRGSFVKTFHQGLFEAQGLATEFAEEFYSLSYRNVVRGLHFQVPPKDLTKVVYALVGEAMDVLVDLRKGSPMFGRYAVCELDAAKANMVYIPSGVAHGFYARSEQVLMVYKVSAVYSPEHDSGIRWDSLDIPWPCNEPIISDRDRNLVPFESFESPFSFCAGGVDGR